MTVREFGNRAFELLGTASGNQLTFGYLLKRYNAAVKLGAVEEDKWEDWKDKVEEYLKLKGSL